MFYVYLQSQGKGPWGSHPCFTDSPESGQGRFEPCIPTKFPSYHPGEEERTSASSLGRWHLHFSMNSPWNTGMFYSGAIWIKRYYMLYVFPSFGQSSSPSSTGMWNSEQPQRSSTFWQILLYEKQYPLLSKRFFSAKPHIESEFKVPYARSNTTHCLLCTQHESAASTLSQQKQMGKCREVNFT